MPAKDRELYERVKRKLGMTGSSDQKLRDHVLFLRRNNIDITAPAKQAKFKLVKSDPKSDGGANGSK